MAVLKYTDFINESNILSKGIDKIKGFLTKMTSSLKDFFSQKNVEVSKYKSGYKAILKKNGKDLVTVINFSGKKNIKPTNEAKIGFESTNDNIPDVETEELIEVLEDAMVTGAPVFIWGAPGIGKSSIVEGFCEDRGLDIILMDLPNMEPSDFIGVPDIKTLENGERVSENALPLFWPRDNGPEGKGGIIFFDEMNLASPPVFKACQLITSPSRRLGRYKLPSKWVIIAAGNRSGEADVTQLTIPQSTRYRHVNFVPSFKAWVAWGEKTKSEIEFKKDSRGSGNSEKTMLDDPKEMKKVARISPEIIAFLSWMKDKWHAADTETLGDGSPFPTPRTWDAACKVYYARMYKKSPYGDVPLSKKEVENIFSSHIGVGAAREFASFYELIKDFPLEHLEFVYNDPKKAKLPPVHGGKYKPDATYAIITAIALHKKKSKLTALEFDNVIEYACRLTENEYSSLLVKLVRMEHPEVFVYLDDLKNFDKWVEKVNVDPEKFAKGE